MTLPGTLITFAAAAFMNGQPVATCEKQIVVVSAAYPRPVFVCGYNSGDGTMPTIEAVAPEWAAGWKVRRRLKYGAGCPSQVTGIQTRDGRLFTEHGLVE